MIKCDEGCVSYKGEGGLILAELSCLIAELKDLMCEELIVMSVAVGLNSDKVVEMFIDGRGKEVAHIFNKILYGEE